MYGFQYYRFLASTLPPLDLGDAVFRRTRRQLERRLRGMMPRAEPSQSQLLRHLKVGSLEDLAERLRLHPGGRGVLEPSERATARALVQEHLPWLPAKICEAADRILDGELHLFGSWREHSRGELEPGIAAIDWLRDPLHGGRAPAGPSAQIDVLASGVDTRATWEPARLAHVLHLAQAHTLAGLPGTQGCRGEVEREIYARAAVLHLRDFIATQPLRYGLHWTCAMEAGLRAIHVSWALSLLRDSPALGPSFWAEQLVWLWEHIRFISEEIEDSQVVAANHLLADLAGLVVVGCFFPELPGATLWRKSALERFSRELLRQSTADGFSFESSTAYHRFVVELGLVVQAAALRQGLSLSPGALERLWLMSRVAENFTLPHGLMPQVGDNDDSRGCVFHWRPGLDASHLASARVALGGPVAEGCPLEPEALWLGGCAGFRRAFMACRNGRKQRDLEVAGGLAVLRGSGGIGASLWAGPNGQKGLGGHAHNDKLACEIVIGGRQLVVDPGSPVYSFAAEERDRYRKTAQHPTVQVDGLEQSPLVAGRPFLLPETANARIEFAEAGRVRAEHQAWLQLGESGVLHQRELILPPSSRMVVAVDRIYGEGCHVVELRWPLATREVLIRPPTAWETADLSLPLELRERFALNEAHCLALGDPEQPIAVVFLWSRELREQGEGGEGRNDDAGDKRTSESAENRGKESGSTDARQDPSADPLPEFPPNPHPSDSPKSTVSSATAPPGVLEVKESCWSPGYGQRMWGRTVLLRLRSQLPLELVSCFVAGNALGARQKH